MSEISEEKSSRPTAKMYRNYREYMISPSTSSCSLERPITDEEDRRLYAECKLFDDYTYCIKKLLELLNDKQGVVLVQRQCDLLQTFLTYCPSGFDVINLSDVSDVMEYLGKNCKDNRDYEEMLTVMLNKASSSLPRYKTSDDSLKSARTNLQDYFTMYGKLLALLEDGNLVLAIVNTLRSLFSFDKSPHRESDHISSADLADAVGASCLSWVLVKMLQSVPESLYFWFLELAIDLIAISEKCCLNMIENDIISTVLWRLDPLFYAREDHIPPVDTPVLENTEYNMEFYQQMDIFSKVLWSVMETVSRYPGVQVPPPSLSAMWSLKLAFRREIRKKLEYSKKIRNNLASLIFKLCACFPDIPVFESGLSEDIILLAVATETDTENTWAAGVLLGTSDLDFCLKKLMIYCCCVLSKNTHARQIFKQQKILDGLLHHVNLNSTKLPVQWTKYQSAELLFLSLRTLPNVANVVPEEFVSKNGTTRLLKLLNDCLEDKADTEILLECFKTLTRIVCSDNNGVILEDVRMECSIDLFLRVLNHIYKQPHFNSEHLRTLTCIFTLLEQLVRDQKHLLYQYGEQFVDVCVQTLVRIKCPVPYDQHDSYCQISFGNFLWEVIAWYESNLKMFIDREGVFLLLDAIEKCSYPVQVIFLGALVDMTEDGLTIPHLITWRGQDKKYGLMNLLMKIWKHEETKFGVKRRHDGVIEDLEAPLASEEQLSANLNSNSIVGPSVVDMFGRARPKIYSLYQQMKKIHRDKTEIAESVYKLDWCLVSSGLQVYYPLIENFLTLKLGEVWLEVVNYQRETGFIPTTFDGELLSVMLKNRNDWALKVQVSQEKVLKLDKRSGADSESKLYDILKSCRLPDWLEAMHELELVARTSNKVFQKEKKLRQIQELRDSKWRNDLNVFSYFNPNFDVTVLNEECVIYNQEEAHRNSASHGSREPSIFSITDDVNW